jgi:hypothetical protein
VFILKSIGLTYAQIDDILKKALDHDKPVDCDAMRDVIATAIVENNYKVLKDISDILSTK